MTDIIEDKILIQQYIKGDEASLEILIARYLKPIYSFVYKNVGNPSEAEDITQEVFIKIWKNIKKFDRNFHTLALARFGTVIGFFRTRPSSGVAFLFGSLFRTRSFSLREISYN